MAVQQPVEPGAGVVEFATPVAYWADDVDEPIRLARFPCCGRYVCRCDEDDEEAWVNR
jgi:hypothetical protein